MPGESLETLARARFCLRALYRSLTTFSSFSYFGRSKASDLIRTMTLRDKGGEERRNTHKYLTDSF